MLKRHSSLVLAGRFTGTLALITRKARINAGVLAAAGQTCASPFQYEPTTLRSGSQRIGGHKFAVSGHDADKGVGPVCNEDQSPDEPLPILSLPPGQ